jgi:hypothetical protein
VSVFSCCCDWGFEIVQAVGIQDWYLSEVGATPRLEKLIQSSGLTTGTSAFANAGRVAQVGDLAGTPYFYVVLVSGTPQILRYEYGGTLNWTHTGTGMASGNAGWLNPNASERMSLDASGNSYLCGWVTATGVVRVNKVDSSGSQVWSVDITPTVGFVYQASSIAVDASGNIAICGRSLASGSDFSELILYLDSSGTEVWRYEPATAVGNQTTSLPNKILFDDSGNLHILYSATTGQTEYASYDSSGSLRFAKTFGYINRATTQFADIEVFGSFLYTARQDSATKDVILTRRSDSTLSTTDWTVTIPYTETILTACRIAVDSSGNLFAIHTGFTSPNFFGYYTKRAAATGADLFSAVTNGISQPLVPPGKPPIFI